MSYPKVKCWHPEHRIDWILDVARNRKLPRDDSLKPIFILALVLSYKGKKQLKFGRIFDYSKQTSVAKQRFARIKLLDEVHVALELSNYSCAKSWNTYFSLQGKEILSEEEFVFWRDKLRGNYELLPVIGFQLCFLDFCSDCMSPHPERLAYSSFRVVYDNSFHDFYVQNSSAIRKLSISILEHPDSHVREVVRQYRVYFGVRSPLARRNRSTITEVWSTSIKRRLSVA